MDKEKIHQLLMNVKEGTTSIDEALAVLKSLPFEDMGFAVIDNHRSLRKGFPEVIFCQGKETNDIIAIAQKLSQHHDIIIGTRAGEEVYTALEPHFSNLVYNKRARFFRIGNLPDVKTAGALLVITAGTADLPVAEEAALTAESMGCRVQKLFDVGVAGIHRLFSRLEDIQRAGVIIVAAGMEGALPSIIGGIADCPVIAVPTSVGYGASFGGISALLTMLNTCAPGVVTVNIDNGFGAGYAATMILRGGQS